MRNRMKRITKKGAREFTRPKALGRIRSVEEYHASIMTLLNNIIISVCCLCKNNILVEVKEDVLCGECVYKERK